MADAPSPEPGPDGLGAVALGAQDVAGPVPRPSRAEAGHPYRVRHGREPGAVVDVPASDSESERTPHGIARQVNFAGQSTSEASECGAAEPSFRAPAACWRARTTVESTDTSQSMSPATSAWAPGGPEHPPERAVQGPPAEPGVRCGPRTVPLGHVTPSGPGAELPHDPVEHLAVVQPLPAPQRLGQQRRDELPLGIRQFMTTYHPTMIHHSRSFEDTA